MLGESVPNVGSAVNVPSVSSSWVMAPNKRLQSSLISARSDKRPPVYTVSLKSLSTSAALLAARKSTSEFGSYGSNGIRALVYATSSGRLLMYVAEFKLVCGRNRHNRCFACILRPGTAHFLWPSTYPARYQPIPLDRRDRQQRGQRKCQK